MSQPASAAPTGGTSGAPAESSAAQEQPNGSEQWRYKGWGPQGPRQYQGPYAAYAARQAAALGPGAPTPPPPPGPAFGPSRPTSDLPPVRRAYRRTEGRVVAGVAGGVADHLGISDTLVRLVLIAATVFGGFGVLIYAALWFLMPLGTPVAPAAPGLAAHTRSGLRSDEPPPPVTEAKARKREKNRGQVTALVVVGAGVLLLLQVAGIGIAGKMFWPLVFAGTGLALIWRQADERQKDEWREGVRVPVLGALVGKGGAKSIIRLAVGLMLVGTAVAVFLVQNGKLSQVGDVLIALLLAVVGLGVIAGPWVQRLTRDLNSERAERIRSQERADMAAHLHDSVLQTLALIQKQANDPRAVTTLARSQERELRAWLYDEDDKTDQTLAGAAKRAAAEVEDSHGVPIEVVTVGDCELSEGMSAMVRAARESMVNAAKHSGAAKIDVFVEVDGDRAEMFVRDRGNGFDVDGVPDDRLGLRHSVMGRMERHGGRATVRSDPETGTEVRLEMDR
ncbi:ATP-binding protein [Kribbella albertanoniae]|uniref:ATP-binding protein n=1 Tax=Kribbella albertanoniae TaxID=1266829 RepID=A0A4V2XQH3_9ACTN|nr:ATP-binding protein [Kribbella albertanoniae]TDC25525.1 ATP-binding protein [Kribbella albertanoniae]